MEIFKKYSKRKSVIKSEVRVYVYAQQGIRQPRQYIFKRKFNMNNNDEFCFPSLLLAGEERLQINLNEIKPRRHGEQGS